MLEASQLEEWRQELAFFWTSQVGWRFKRAEARERGLKYVKGLLSETKRKNGWPVAEAEGELRTDGLWTGYAMRCGSGWWNGSVRQRGCWWWMKRGFEKRVRLGGRETAVQRHRGTD